MNRLLRLTFAAAVLTIGLDQYRPVLGAVGNLSDVLFQGVFIVGAALWFLRLDAERLQRLLQVGRELEPLLWGGVLLTLGGAIASLQSSAPSASWQVTLKYFGTFCVWLPWATFAVERYLSANRACVLYVLGFCLIAVATLSDLLVGTRFGAMLVSTPVYEVNLESVAGVFRYGGPTGHPNTLGYVSMIGFLLCLSGIAREKWRRLTPWLAGLVPCGAVLLISGSRAAFVGLVVGSFVVLLLSGRAATPRLLGALLACVAAMWISLGVSDLPSDVNPVVRLAESFRPRRSFEADWQRRRDLDLSQRLLSQDPITGYGMEDIGTSTPPTKVAFSLPHYVVLQSWVAGGVLALFGTLWLYGATLWLAWKAVRQGRPWAVGLLATCVAFILTDMVHPGLNQRFKWFAVALLVATLRPVPLVAREGRFAAASVAGLGS